MRFLLTGEELLSGSNVLGYLLITAIAAIGGMWAYFTNDRKELKNSFSEEKKKFETFFLEERKKYEDQLKEDDKKIENLQHKINEIKDESFQKLEIAYKKLDETNRALSEQLIKSQGK